MKVSVWLVRKCEKMKENREGKIDIDQRREEQNLRNL